MDDSRYQVRAYRPEDRRAVADLVECLYHGEASRRLATLRWKYESNPYVSSPPACVVDYPDRSAPRGIPPVVGFLGLTVMRFACEGQQLLVRSPGDAAVHPDHRRRGILTEMTRWSRRQVQGSFPLYLTTTANRQSLPAALGAGYFPLASGVSLCHSTASGLERYLLAKRRGQGSSETRTLLDLCGSDKLPHSEAIRVEQAPRPDAMAALAADHPGTAKRIRLVQDTAFFQWRYGNPLGKYVFLFQEARGRPVGYLVLGLGRNPQRAHILDYGADPEATLSLVRYVIRSRLAGILSVPLWGLDCELASNLTKLGFGQGGPAGWLVNHGPRHDLPILVRPGSELPVAEDWFVDGVDVRHPGNWCLKPIVSDAA